MGMNGRAEESEISHEIDDFVAYEFIGPAQAIGVENLRLIENDRVVEVPAAREASVTQGFDFANEAKRTCRRKIAFEDLFIEGRDFERLATDTGMRKVDRIRDPKSVRGFDPNPAIAIANLEGLDNREFTRTGALPLLSGAPNQFHEGRSTPVHRRNFRSLDFDANVVDSECEKRGQQMLDCCDLRAP